MTKSASTVTGSPPGPRPSTPTTRPSPRRRTPVTVTPVRSVAPARTAASCSSPSSRWRRGATRWSTPARSLIRRTFCASPSRKSTSRTAGAPEACTSSSRPQRASWTTPPRAMPWVDTVSLGKGDRSRSSTSCPALASSIAVAAPAQRAPTTTTWWCSTRVLMTVDSARSVPWVLGDGVERTWRRADESAARVGAGLGRGAASAAGRRRPGRRVVVEDGVELPRAERDVRHVDPDLVLQWRGSRGRPRRRCAADRCAAKRSVVARTSSGEGSSTPRWFSGEAACGFSKSTSLSGGSTRAKLA